MATVNAIVAGHANTETYLLPCVGGCKQTAAQPVALLCIVLSWQMTAMKPYAHMLQQLGLKQPCCKAHADFSLPLASPYNAMCFPCTAGNPACLQNPLHEISFHVQSSARQVAPALQPMLCPRGQRKPVQPDIQQAAPGAPPHTQWGLSSALV